jgi:hypothetical protein
MDPVQLTGAPESVEVGSGVSLIAPGLWGTAELPDSAQAPTTQQDRDFERSLGNAGFSPRRPFIVSPSSAPAGEVTVNFPPAEHGQRAILLVRDESGVVSWHLPSSPPGHAKASGSHENPAAAPTPGADASTAASLQFVIPARRFGRSPESAPPAVPAGSTPPALFGGSSLAKKVLSVLEYPVAKVAGRGAAEIYGLWEGQARPSVVTWFPPGPGLLKGVPLTDASWRAIAQGRALLFIHGIFSNCTDTFNPLDDPTWVALKAAYPGRILAFDHPTASVSPEDNVKAFLAQIPPGVKLDIDIVAHSRGGLVARILAGQLSHLKVKNVKVGKIVFAGTPNGGTAITAPANWNALVDRFTNMLKLVPPGPWTQTTTTFEGVLEMVKVIGESAEQVLPGLNAMEPGSPLLVALGLFSGARPEYFAIDTNFVPLPAFAHIFAVKDNTVSAGDAVIDIVFQHRPNDVAVPTIGVGDPGDSDVDPPPAPGAGPAVDIDGFPVPADHHLPFGPCQVWHLSYFTQQLTGKKLVEWLT